MPQDKRLIITKAVVCKLQRVCEEKKKDASSEGVYIYFTVPVVLLSQSHEISSHLFPLVHSVFPANGRSTCLIVPKVISSDCFRINKRHHYVDAVITAESICRRQDAESAKRAEVVATSFKHFLVDARIVAKLPLAITEAVKKAGVKKEVGSSSGTSGDSVIGPACPPAALSSVEGLDHKESLAIRLSQAAGCGMVRSVGQGQIVFRVGHGGMTGGDICENAKGFVFALKRDFPSLWRYIMEFKLTTNRTDAIRFMEVQRSR